MQLSAPTQEIMNILERLGHVKCGLLSTRDWNLVTGEIENVIRPLLQSMAPVSDEPNQDFD